jgi:hydrogenase nickel incorporation protein HypB
MYKVELGKKILSANEEYAAKNAAFFKDKCLLCLNMISSPGSGKTSILAKTITHLKDKLRIGVIEGDIQTQIDADRIRATGASAVQIETEGACHLTAGQINEALTKIPCPDLDVVFIENVGNLVCPSTFELGETAKVAVLSVAEGDDKPAKYPAIFARAHALLINKIDLLGAVDFDINRVRSDVTKLNKDIAIFPVSAKTGEGMDLWCDWLTSQAQKTKTQ